MIPHGDLPTVPTAHLYTLAGVVRPAGFFDATLWVHGLFPAGRTVPCGAWYIRALLVSLYTVLCQKHISNDGKNTEYFVL